MNGPTLLRSGANTVATNVLQVILSLMLSIIIARTLGPEKKGVLDLYNATGALLCMVLGVSLQSGIIYVVAKGGINKKRILLQLFGIAVIQGIVAYTILKLINHTNLASLFLPHALGQCPIFLIPIFVFISLIGSYMRSMLVGNREFIKANRCDIVTVFVTLIASTTIILLYKTHNKPSVLILLAISQLFALMVAGIFLFNYTKTQLKSVSGNSSGLGMIFSYGSTCFLANLAQYMNYRMDVFFVQHFVGSVGLGLYALAVTITNMMRFVPSAAASIILPSVAAHQHNDQEASSELAVRTSRVILPLNIITAVTFAIAGMMLIPLVYGKAYIGSITPMLLLLPGMAAFGLTTILASYLSGMGLPKINMYASLAGLVLTVLFDVLLIPGFGITGAAIASTLSYLTSTIITVVYFCRITHCPLRRVLIPVWSDDKHILERIISGITSKFGKSQGNRW